MATPSDVSKQSKSDAASKDENLFNAWRSRKDSTHAPAGILKEPGAAGRRMSNARALQKGAGALRRMTLIMRAKSDISSDMLKPQVKKENTYKMTPDDGSKFSASKVQKSVYQLIHDTCEDMAYDTDYTSTLTCDLSEKIRDRVKEMGFPRYKIAANVFISQIADQGIEVASRCCWDHTTDNYISVSYRNKSLMVLALVFGVYFE